jgi:hypothetical protein
MGAIARTARTAGTAAVRLLRHLIEESKGGSTGRDSVCPVAGHG